MIHSGSRNIGLKVADFLAAGGSNASPIPSVGNGLTVAGEVSLGLAVLLGIPDYIGNAISNNISCPGSKYDVNNDEAIDATDVTLLLHVPLAVPSARAVVAF